MRKSAPLSSPFAYRRSVFLSLDDVPPPRAVVAVRALVKSTHGRILPPMAPEHWACPCVRETLNMSLKKRAMRARSGCEERWIAGYMWRRMLPWWRAGSPIARRTEVEGAWEEVIQKCLRNTPVWGHGGQWLEASSGDNNGRTSNNTRTSSCVENSLLKWNRWSNGFLWVRRELAWVPLLSQ